MTSALVQPGQVPTGQRACQRYCHKICGRCVWFWCKALARVALPAQVSCIGCCCWPVKPSSENFSHNCSTTCMMTTRAFVYLSQQSLCIVDGDAPLEDARDTSFIKFANYYSECFRATHSAPSLCWIVWQLLSKQICQ
jgi:hypothetical protein